MTKLRQKLTKIIDESKNGSVWSDEIVEQLVSLVEEEYQARLSCVFEDLENHFGYSYQIVNKDYQLSRDKYEILKSEALKRQNWEELTSDKLREEERKSENLYWGRK